MATVTTFNRRSTDRPGTSIPNTAPLAPTRRAYRERDMGIGYGRSSGYASERRYADLSAPVLMRCR